MIGIIESNRFSPDPAILTARDESSCLDVIYPGVEQDHMLYRGLQGGWVTILCVVYSVHCMSQTVPGFTII